MFAFMDTFRGLLRIFPKRLDEHDQQHMGASYFKTLRKYPLAQIQAGAEGWIQRGKYFPKPAEWIDAIPRERQRAVELQTLSDEDGRAHRRAEALCYEDAPCHCRECRAAGVTDRPLRYVPEVNEDGSDRKALDGDRTVTVGHWAHGAELARWYEARADFWNRCHELGLTSVAKELAKVQAR